MAMGALLAAPLLLDSAVGDSTEVRAGKLPGERRYADAVWTGQRAYVFGGCCQPSTTTAVAFDDILVYDPATESVTRAASRLPGPRWEAPAVWTGRYAYIFGGSPLDGPAPDEILRYDPAADVVAVAGARLPRDWVPRDAWWTGQHAFILGNIGCSTDEPCQEILRYDPASDQLMKMNGNLGVGHTGTMGAWSGRYVYLAGGCCEPNGGGLTNKLYRYDPQTDTAITLPQTLPYALRPGAAVWDARAMPAYGCPEGCLYLLGSGYLIGSEFVDGREVIRFDPAGGRVTIMPAWVEATESSVVADGTGILIIGGGSSVAAGEIRRYSLAPQSPAFVTARAGPGAGEIRIEWEQPGHGDEVNAYRIYGSDVPGASRALRTLGAELGWTEPGLPHGAQRFYRVSALNGAGDEGPRSVELSATTFNVPAAPAWINFSQGGAPYGLRLDWPAPAADGGAPILRYRVYAGERRGEEALIGEPTGTNFTYQPTPPDVSGWYRVSAVNAAGEGPSSPYAGLNAGGGAPGVGPVGLAVAVAALVGARLRRRR